MDIEEKINNGEIQERLDEQGVPEYLLKTEGDLEEVAVAIKDYLEKQTLIAHDFSSRVWNKQETGSVSFDYRSNWPLDGLADGEVE